LDASASLLGGRDAALYVTLRFWGPPKTAAETAITAYLLELLTHEKSLHTLC